MSVVLYIDTRESRIPGGALRVTAESFCHGGPSASTSAKMAFGEIVGRVPGQRWLAFRNRPLDDDRMQ